jgi:ADP-heptose:LPS heptosyltransferase
MSTRALVAAGGGVGDVLRATPLVRVLAALGHDVDVAIVPDYLGIVALLDGAPEIRRLYHRASDWCRVSPGDPPRERLAGLAEAEYDVAVVTMWGAPVARHARARRTITYDRARWTHGGDPACAEDAARALGWGAPLPAPFAVPSARTFDVAPGTVALHPGCKPGWPWKKWHGFDALAAALPDVVIVGTAADAENAGTYFGRAFEWPAHARSYVGALSLADTAALLARCAALVSNDSGLLHLGVALGVPTLGVFGLTSPARELMPAARATAVTKGLPCEPACRRQPWGRRDCTHHLRCLRTLEPDEVLARLRALLDAPEVAHA